MSIPPVSLAISPCPNDTFIFYAWLHGLAPGAPEISSIKLEDVETLNAMAQGKHPGGGADVIKVSAALATEALDEFVILDVGAALGWGNGPVLTAREELAPEAIRTLALPGERTTAALLAWEFGLRPATTLQLRYDEVAPAVLEGKADAGVCIHEERFTLHERGLLNLLDFGTWWEATFKLPLPLGVILGRRSLGAETLHAVEQAMRASLDYAWEHPEEAMPFIRGHAQSMQEEVLEAHIRTFVTGHTRSLGEDGRQAITTLAGIAAARRGGSAPAAIFNE